MSNKSYWSNVMGALIGERAEKTFLIACLAIGGCVFFSITILGHVYDVGYRDGLMKGSAERWKDGQSMISDLVSSGRITVQERPK